MKIKVIATGGSIDRTYDPIQSKMVFTCSHIPILLDIAHARRGVSFETVVLKVSTELAMRDKARIANACVHAKEKHIVITHGTDTMFDTARYLHSHVPDKTVVLTGAMRPSVLRDSDALFNLGAAVALVQVLPFGVYVTMHGKLFSHENGIKNGERGEFTYTTSKHHE